MKQPALLLCLPGILLYVHAAVAAPSAPPSGSVSEMQRKQPRSVLAGDARLRVPLTAKYVDRPFGEILAAVGRELKLSLRADRTVVDDRATLCVRGRPAAECVDALAQQFGFQWRRKNGYELWQSSASLRGEAFLREQDLAAQVKALEAQMQRVAELKIDEVNAAARARELERNLFSDAASLPMAEQKRRTAEWSRMQREAAAPLAIAVYQSLTPSQTRRLVEAGELFLTSTDGTLSAALSARVNSLAASLFSSPVFDPLQAHVDIRLDEGTLEVAKPPANPTPHLSLRFTLTSLRRLDKVPEGQVDTRPAFGPKRPPAQAVTQNWWPELPPETADQVEAPTDDPLLRQEVDLQFPRAAQRRLSTTANPDSPRGALTSGSAWPTDWVTLGEIAEALHTTTGLNVIADSFVRTRLDPARLSGKRSVAWYSCAAESSIGIAFRRSQSAFWSPGKHG